MSYTKKTKTILGSHGVLNDVSAPSAPSYEGSYLNSLREAAKNHHTPDSLAGKTEFKAVVIRVDNKGEAAAEPPSYWASLFSELLGTVGGKRVAVRARIPELHVALPIPKDEKDNGVIELYPQFICDAAIYSDPGVGDIIRVSFGNTLAQTDPVIIGKESSGNAQSSLDVFSSQKGCISAVKDSLKVEPVKSEKIVKSNITRMTTPIKNNAWEVEGNRENIQRSLESVASSNDAPISPTTEERKPSSETSKAKVAPDTASAAGSPPSGDCQVSFKMSDVSDPNLDSPPASPIDNPPSEGKYAIYQTSTGKKRGEEEMTKVKGKLVMTKEIFPAFQKLSKAARAAGVKIQLNSGFRSFEEQFNLRRQNVLDRTKINDKKYLINKRPQRGNFKPLTAQPGRSNHQSGTAIDLQTGMPRGGPHPNKITKTWRWLANHAHEFGFVRTVVSERWHFVYVGVNKAAARRFQRVPRNHSSWDGMF
jgi:hypothetical protein